jgi:hypothetical protein
LIKNLPSDEVELLLKSGSALARYHQAFRDGLAVAAGRSSRKLLVKNMERAGIVRPPGYEGHHIVAFEAKRATDAKAILKSFGIGIDDAENGVFLAAGADTPKLGNEASHGGIHTNAYYDAVTDALMKARDRIEAIEILRKIGEALLSGGFP